MADKPQSHKSSKDSPQANRSDSSMPMRGSSKQSTSMSGQNSSSDRSERNRDRSAHGDKFGTDAGNTGYGSGQISPDAGGSGVHGKSRSR